MDATRPRLCFLAALRSVRGIAQVRMLPAVFSFSSAVSSAASLRSGCSPASSLLSRGFSKLPRHRSGQDVTRSLCFGAALSSAALSGLSATVAFSFSSASTPRHPSGLDVTRPRLRSLAAFRDFRGIAQVRMLPAVFSFSSAFSSAASLRLVCYPCPSRLGQPARRLRVECFLWFERR
jgi:hypothetical protein